MTALHHTTSIRLLVVYCVGLSLPSIVRQVDNGFDPMRIFRVTFINQGKIYLLYAEAVRQAEVYGFVEIEGLIFGETSSVVIDPGEEKLKNEFSGVTRTLVPIHAVIRVDEVEKRGQSTIIALGIETNITQFPSSLYTPGKSTDN